VRENRPLGLTWRGLETNLRFGFQGTISNALANQLFTRAGFCSMGTSS
jgi:hypothetical protein